MRARRAQAMYKLSEHIKKLDEQAKNGDIEQDTYRVLRKQLVDARLALM